MHGWVCAFADVFGGIEKQEVSHMWDGGGGEVKDWKMPIKNSRTDLFPWYKSDSPVHWWVCVFADVFGGIGKGELGEMWDSGGGEVEISEKEKCS